ncbi:efflux RND transporter periplasmic adaptor subunit [Roseiarcus sp.]|uniref:efflux RND transporter periplasmic adaptor subunit n=1 Tax=Roseiarcus sp. TaxID=1969460 RepID=UPI003F951CE3
MNDLGFRNRTDGFTADHLDDRPFDRDPQTPQKPRPKARRRRGMRVFAVGAFLLVAGGVAFGAWSHYSQAQEVTATAEQERDFVPSVRVATVKASPTVMSVTLPATTAAFAQAEIYARATGYIGQRFVDIGDRVKQGQPLAELAVPEQDDQISQNVATRNQLQAALDQAQANLKLAQVTWDRDRPLVNEGWATQQQGTIDVQTLKANDAAVGVAQANIAAQDKLLMTLRQNRDYASVTAPFNGVITQRNVDVGSLVQGNANTGTFMFEVMQRDVIRVFVYVPQDAAFGVAPGVDAIIRVPEIPNREFPGKVTRIADALQSGTRTLLTEIDIPNRDEALPPGVYCTVELKIPRPTPSFVVPAEAIIFNRNGLQVAVVNNGKTEIRKLEVTRDFGTWVEADAGVKPGEQVILSPPVNLVDGDKVQLRSNVMAPAT